MEYETRTTDGMPIFAALHARSECGPAAISLALGDSHTELTLAEARGIGELLLAGVVTIEKQSQ